MNRIGPMLLLALGAPITSTTAQWTREPICDKPGGNVIACALQAGKVADLRDGPRALNEREIRFWSLSGRSEPEEVLVIHQRGDTVTGRLLLIWYDSIRTDSFALEVCTTEMWESPGGSLCVARSAKPHDWPTVLKELDKLGLSQLPGNPTPIDPCYLTAGKTEYVSGVPVDRVCRVLLGGVSLAIEVRTSTVYWRYAFQRVPDTAAPELTRDNAILSVLSCVARKVGDRPC